MTVYLIFNGSGFNWFVDKKKFAGFASTFESRQDVFCQKTYGDPQKKKKEENRREPK
jgi:hypothetical protein